MGEERWWGGRVRRGGKVGGWGEVVRLAGEERCWGGRRVRRGGQARRGGWVKRKGEGSEGWAEEEQKK